MAKTILSALIFLLISEISPAQKTDPVDVNIVNKTFKDIGGTISFQIWQYEGTMISQKHSMPIDAGRSGKLQIDNSFWKCDISETHSSKDDAIDLEARFEVQKGSIRNSGVAVQFNFTGWTPENYILVPAVLYGGNRFRILPIGYPPYIHEEKDRPPDMPVTVTNIPHLNQDGSYAKVEMTAGNMATPMLAFFNQKKGYGLILLTEQSTRFGNNGLFVEEDAGPGTKNKQMSFIVTAPGVREERYVMCGREKSGDKAADWEKDDNITLRFKIYRFRAYDMTAFYEKVFNVRKSLSGKNSYSCVTPYSTAADLILEHHNAHKWFETQDMGYYCNHPGDKNLYCHQIGWSAIPLYLIPDNIAETPERLRRVSLSLDYVLTRSQGKTGLYYAVNRWGEIFGDPHGEMEIRRTISMTRRSMDVLYFSLQCIDLLKKRGHTDMIKPEWEKSLRACADGLVKVWNDYGQFGQFIDVDNGKMDVNGSTAGCAAGAGLALASLYFNEPVYLDVARAATKMYYERDFLAGYAGGGASEILQSPDSEAPWDMVESCIILYEVTGKQEWIDRAKFATHMLSTWMVSYDYKFPAGSAMEKAGTHAAGSIFASSQNNHSAPGYYILSGDMLLKLFRATGDARYAEMYKDQSHNVVQYVGAPHNPLRKESGLVTERVQLSDWEGNNIGSVAYEDSNMAWEVLAALTCLQNPGIYLHTDDSTFLVMDHLEASVIKRDKTGVTIRITNPTPYDARVSVFAESSDQAKTALPLNSFIQWPRVDVGAGKSANVRVNATGQLAIIN